MRMEGKAGVTTHRTLITFKSLASILKTREGLGKILRICGIHEKGVWADLHFKTFGVASVWGRSNWGIRADLGGVGPDEAQGWVLHPGPFISIVSQNCTFSCPPPRFFLPSLFSPSVLLLSFALPVPRPTRDRPNSNVSLYLLGVGDGTSVNSIHEHHNTMTECDRAEMTGTSGTG